MFSKTNRISSLANDLLTNDLFQHMLQLEGHKQYYIDKAVSYLQSLKDVLNGIKTNIFGKTLNDRLINVSNSLVTYLEGAQVFAFNTIRSRIDNHRIQLNNPDLSHSISSNQFLFEGSLVLGKHTC